MVLHRLPTSAQSLFFLILGQNVRVDCPDAGLRELLVANFGMMTSAHGEKAPADLHYRVESRGGLAPFSFSRQGQAPLDASDPGDLLFLLEKDMTVELQKRRADLLFLHSAALEWQGRACLLAAESGGGKSTTTWALLHHGFRYLSDELSPIDLDSMQVLPYPHALSLKQPPPSYPLPGSTVHLGRTMHVPAPSLPSATLIEACSIGAIFLLSYCSQRSAPTLRSISAAEASARLYVTVLNALAHPDYGLQAVVRVAQHVPCFAVFAADLSTTCALIRESLEESCLGRSRG